MTRPRRSQPLARILLHKGVPDGFLINGWKVPAFISPEVDVRPDPVHDVVFCTVTFICDAVTVLSHEEATRVATEVVTEVMR